MSDARADLHVHTRYSDRPSEWVLRRIGSPESFTEPLEVYRLCRQRGMTFVTISDHNRIDGALDIAHLPGTFISCEVTTYFPEDGCKLHVLVSGITEAQFAQIQKLRENIYDFQGYCIREGIVSTVAHPLFRVNDRLTPWHIERLLLLFKRFEGINGSRDPRACDMSNAILRQLTPAMIDRLANVHKLAPTHDEPWVKWLTAGSDDHGGAYIASAHTLTPEATTVDAFLTHLREGRHQPGGRGGTSLRLAHSFYRIAYSYYTDRLVGSDANSGLLAALFRKLLGEQPPARKRGLFSGVRQLATSVVRSRRLKRVSPTDRMLIEDFSNLFREGRFGAEGEGDSGADRLSFDASCRIAHQLSYTFFERFNQSLRNANLTEAVQSLSSVGPVAMAIMPYLAAFGTQHKDERFLQQVADHFEQVHHLKHRSRRRAWVTDTFADINGVARTIRTMAELARRKQKELTVITCLDAEPCVDANVMNFPPVGRFALPEYDFQKLAFPPFLQIIEYLERERFSELIISTPGPLGLTALAASRVLGLRTSGIYHTDFPTYVAHMTGDQALERLTWRYMYWFFEQMDHIFVPSRWYEKQLADHGFTEGKLRLLPRGVDAQQFSPDHRDADYWRGRMGFESEIVFLYVGRVSSEKNVQTMLDALREVRLCGHDASVAVVGDGPQLRELKAAYREPHIHFTGFLESDELARAYASADVFVFPSTTDTFGNAVLEAHASGLPAIVSDKGGPSEIVMHEHTGLIVDTGDSAALSEAMRRFCRNSEMRRTMAGHALAEARRRTWDAVFDGFWDRPSSDDPAVQQRRTVPRPDRPLRISER